MDSFWLAIGVVGAVLFFGRFYVQWLVSEWRGEYVVPVSFWYMSAGGSVLLFAYAYGRQSPGGTFGLCFNLAIYFRNLILIWREHNTESRVRTAALWVIAALVTLASLWLTVETWRHGYRPTYEFWAWTAAWAVGQALFFARFGVQWIATELQGRSVVPALFWQLSIAGLVFHGAYFTHRADWLLAAGTLADGIPYARNLVLMRRGAKTSAAGNI